MTGRHRALVVEDHRASAEDLEEVLRSLDCDAVVVDNKQEALGHIKATSFCLVLLDLEIKGDVSSIKGHSAHGSSFLRELRTLFPGARGAEGAHLPVLVVSAHANDVDFAVSIMKDGADDVIRKPFESHAVSTRVRKALEQSGRANHEHCATSSVAGHHGARKLVLAIPGNRAKQRTTVSIGGKTATLPDSLLKVLLHLIIAKQDRKSVHKNDLGGSADRGFKGISNLKQALQGVLAEGVDIISNDYHGNYQLSDEVEIGECNTGRLREIDDPKITALANDIERRLPQKV